MWSVVYFECSVEFEVVLYQFSVEALDSDCNCFAGNFGEQDLCLKL